jgi:hypothetical protein
VGRPCANLSCNRSPGRGLALLLQSLVVLDELGILLRVADMLLRESLEPVSNPGLLQEAGTECNGSLASAVHAPPPSSAFLRLSKYLRHSRPFLPTFLANAAHVLPCLLTCSFRASSSCRRSTDLASNEALLPPPVSIFSVLSKYRVCRLCTLHNKMRPHLRRPGLSRRPFPLCLGHIFE